MVLRRALMLTGGGMLLGTLGALALTRLLSTLLFEVTPTDLLTFAAVAAILVIVALLPAWIPPRRALRLDPIGDREGVYVHQVET